MGVIAEVFYDRNLLFTLRLVSHANGQYMDELGRIQSELVGESRWKAFEPFVQLVGYQVAHEMTTEPTSWPHTFVIEGTSFKVITRPE